MSVLMSRGNIVRFLPGLKVLNGLSVLKVDQCHGDDSIPTSILVHASEVDFFVVSGDDGEVDELPCPLHTVNFFNGLKF